MRQPLRGERELGLSPPGNEFAPYFSKQYSTDPLELGGASDAAQSLAVNRRETPSGRLACW